MKFFKNIPKHTIITVLIAVIFTVWSLFLRFRDTYIRLIWNDEMWQIFKTFGPLKAFWLRSNYGDFSTFPGDYLLTYPFIKLFLGNKVASINNLAMDDILLCDLNKWGLLIPQILFTILSFVFLFLLCRRYFKTCWGYVIAFAIMCFHEVLLFHSFEMRTYAFHPALSLGCIYFWDLLFRKYEILSLKSKILISIFFTFVALFHVFGVLFYVFALLFVSYEQKFQFRRFWKYPLGRYILGMSLFFIFVWSWYLFLAPKAEGITIAIPQPVFKFFPDPFKDMGLFFKSLFVDTFLGNSGLTFLILLLPLGVFIKSPERRKIIIIILLYVFSGVGLVFTAALVKKYWFLKRQLIWMIPVFSFVTGWCMDVVMQWRTDYGRQTINIWLNRMIKAVRFLFIGAVLLFFIIQISYFPFVNRALSSLGCKSNPAKVLTMTRQRPNSLDGMIPVLFNNARPSKIQLEEWTKFSKDVMASFGYEFAELYGIAGICHSLSQDDQNAFLEMKQAQMLKPNVFWFTYNVGAILFRYGYFSQAISELEHSLTLNPEATIEFFLNSGHFKFFMNHINRDQKLLESRLQEGRERVFELLVLSYIHNNQPQNAFSVCQKALDEKFSRNDFFYFYQGLIKFSESSYNEAEILFRKSIADNELHAEAHQYLGLTLKNLGHEHAGDDQIKLSAELARKNGSTVKKYYPVQLRLF